MTFLEKTQTTKFWINVVKVAIPFFIIVVIISLIVNSSKDLFSGDFNAVSETNFAQGKWKEFWAYKIVFSIFYGIWVSNKNTK